MTEQELKEGIKILAEAVLEIWQDADEYDWICDFCYHRLSFLDKKYERNRLDMFVHADDCPVLVAQRLLAELEKGE